jgi:hypothetical protein
VKTLGLGWWLPEHIYEKFFLLVGKPGDSSELGFYSISFSGIGFRGI